MSMRRDFVNYLQMMCFYFVDGFQVDVLTMVDIEERVGKVTIESLLNNRNISCPWNIKAITNRLELRGEGMRENMRKMNDRENRSDTSADLARSMRKIGYEVIITGQVFRVDTRWQTRVVEYSSPIPRD